MKDRLAEFTPRRDFPYVHGIFLAVNAISDARVLVDGPNCAFFKAEHIAMTHDMRSTLLDVGGVHRVANPDLCADRMAIDHDERFLALLSRVASIEGTGVILVAALPMASVTGPDYERLAAQANASAPVVILPRRSLDRVWLDGYEDTLTSLARALPLPPAQPEPSKVALIGHLHDRNEADQLANVAEMRRLVQALGLELVSVWLDGGPVASLQRVTEARLLLALPHGRSAARVLAERTGAKVVHVPIPFGLMATDSFVLAAGEASGREREARAVIEEGHAEVAPWLEWLIPRRFLFKHLGFAGDPWMMPGFCELADTLGAYVSVLVAYSRPLDGFIAECRLPVEPLWEPRVSVVLAHDLAKGLDLFVCNSALLREIGGLVRTVEFGYPSYGYHCSFDAPFLGYRGLLAFTDRLSNALGDPPGLLDN